MGLISFASLPDDARLYVLAAADPVRESDRADLLRRVDAFLEEWSSHKREVTAGREWRYDRFLFIGVDERETDLSGCSIDRMRHDMDRVAADLGIRWLEGSPVLYKDGDAIRSVSRPEFREKIAAGRAGAETIVFNNVIGTVGDLRSGKWEVPMRDSWHMRAFPIASKPLPNSG